MRSSTPTSHEALRASTRRRPLRARWGELITVIAVAFVVASHPAAASAAPPTNDNFANAITLSGTSSIVAGTTQDATYQANEDDVAHSEGAGRTVWYKWTSTCSCDVTFDTWSSPGDNIITVYTGPNFSNLTAVDAGRLNRDLEDDFDNTAYASALVRNATLGKVYYIQVDDWNSEGPFTLRTNYPWRDDFTDAPWLSPNEGTVSWRDNYWATKQSGEPNHAGNAGGASIWFRFRPTVSGTYWIDTMSAHTNIDTLLAIYTGNAVGSLSPVASNDNFGAGENRSRLSVALTGGTTYRIAVDGRNGAKGDIGIRWSRAPGAPPSNDNLTNAIAFGGTSYSATASNVGATYEVGETQSGWRGDSSVWYAFTAPSSGYAVFDTIGTTMDSNMGIYTGSLVTTLTELMTNDDFCHPANELWDSQVWAMVTAGTTYRVKIDGQRGEWSDAIPFHMRTGAPYNDSFSSAFNLVGASVSSPCDNVIGATQQAGEPEHTNHVGDTGRNSVWYTWTAPNSGTARITTDNGASDFDEYLAVYTGSAVSALTTVVKRDDDWRGETVTFSAVAGTTYRIAIDGYDSGAAGNEYERMGNFVLQVNPEPDNPAPIDGTVAGVDVDYAASTTQLSATWTAVTSDPVTSYDWCIVAGGDNPTCTGALSTGNSATTAVTVTGTFAEGALYRICVRSRTDFVAASTYTCTDGQRPDVSTPAPTFAADGLGADIDTQSSSTQLIANWAAVTDAGIGLKRYDYCFSTSSSCSGTIIVGWTPNGTSTSVTRNGLSLTNGQTYVSCVRAVDMFDNISPVTCSDGVTVTIPTAPTITSLSPATAAQGRAALSVTVTGTNFAPGASAAFSGSDVSVVSTTYVSSTMLTLVINVDSTGSPGQRDLTVTNTDLQTGIRPNAFTVTAASLTLAVSTLGFEDSTRDAPLPLAVSFGTMVGGVDRIIGVTGSGQTLAGPAVRLSITSDANVSVTQTVGSWSGPETVAAGALQWKHFGTAEAWTTASVTDANVAPGAPPLEFALKLGIPTNQGAGTYSTSLTYTVVSAI